jgi:stage IV sporulation protein FB
VIEFREPPRTGLELRWFLFGIRFRVLPSFFLVSAILAFLFVGFNPIGIAIDVACIFFAIVFTEFVQGIVYRSYGLRSTVLIQEFGGGIYPEAQPPTALQRIVVALANPASSFLLLALVYYSNQEYHWRDENKYLGFAYFILWLVSLFWGIIGLLPIFPYPGGRVMLELLTLVSPRNGLVWTLVISIVVALAYIAYSVAVYFSQMVELPLVEGYKLPASIILSVFLALATFNNWQFLQIARAQRRQYSTYDDYHDDKAPWERQ